jgi:pimeloyl-ACP methyl ester carboxylesterase
MKALSVALSLLLAVAWAAAAEGATKSVVLVHGAFADGSGWRPVTSILERDGYSVFVVQEPLTSFDADVGLVRLTQLGRGPSWVKA